jgi:hypothetical protein
VRHVKITFDVLDDSGFIINVKPTSSSAILIPFGRYRDTPLHDIAQTDEGRAYLRWVLSLQGGSGSASDFADNYADAIQATLDAAITALSKDAPPILVTPHQQAAVDLLYQQVLAGVPVVRLEGGAGYGKSYAVKKLLLQLREAGIQSKACAISYVATQVLARDLEPYGFTAETVARTLKLAKVFNDGVETYEMTRDSLDAAKALTSTGNLLCVDEASMVNDEMAAMLMESVNGGTLLLVGDRYQLPPVGQETTSICCDTPNPATLNEPMRYSRESMLYLLEQVARYEPHRIFEIAANPFSDGEIVRVNSPDELIGQYIINYLNKPTTSHRMLLFKRQDVTDANNHVRRLIYGPFAEDLERGEQIMILRTSDHPYVKNATLGEVKRYYSGETFTVQECEQSIHLGIPCWTVKLEGREKPVRCIFAVSEVKADEARIGGVEYTVAMANAFQTGRETGNATSIHRAQGQTVDYSYTLPMTLMQIKGLIGKALLYVALTRARKQAIMRI